MRVACVGYRDWALQIYDNLAATCECNFLIIRSLAQYNKELIRDFKPDLVLFYGWSWKIEKEIINDYICLMLHPSELPKYRGGSPIQNQIIDGITVTKASIFKMVDEIDAGDIVAQSDLSLDGYVDEILDRLTKIGIEETRILLKHGITTKPQKHEFATYRTRLTPKESEITVDELINEKGEYLYNKIRMLTGPYPRAYFKTRDGKKILFDKVRLID